MNLSRHGLDESRIPAYMHKNRCIHTSRIRMHLQLQINIRRSELTVLILIANNLAIFCRRTHQLSNFRLVLS